MRKLKNTKNVCLKKKPIKQIYAVPNNNSSYNFNYNMWPGFDDHNSNDDLSTNYCTQPKFSIWLNELDINYKKFVDCELPSTYIKKPYSTQFCYVNAKQMTDFFTKLLTPVYLNDLTLNTRANYFSQDNNSCQFRRQKRLDYVNRALQQVYGTNCIDYAQVPFDSVAYGWQQFLVSHPDYFNVVLLKMLWYEYCSIFEKDPIVNNWNFALISRRVLKYPIFEQIILKEILLLTRPFEYLQNLPNNYFQQKRIKISNQSLFYLQPLGRFKFETATANRNPNIEQSYEQFWNHTICELNIRNFLMPSIQKYQLNPYRTPVYLVVTLTRFYALIDFWNSTVMQSDN